jgi:hypothetical protein
VGHVVAWVDETGQWQPVTEAGFDGHQRLALYVWRSVRAGGGTKTEKSRRTLDHGLVFCIRNGTALTAGNVRRAFRSITKASGVGEDWTPASFATPSFRFSVTTICRSRRSPTWLDTTRRRHSEGLPAPDQARDHHGRDDDERDLQGSEYRRVCLAAWAPFLTPSAKQTFENVRHEL